MKSEQRMPPASVEVEKSILGAVLIDGKAITQAIEIINSEDFYSRPHQKYFAAMSALFERSEPVDLITVIEELKRMEKYDNGDPGYLAKLAGDVSSSANVEYYARLILEKALLRRFITDTSNMISRAYDESEDALELLNDAEGVIFAISEKKMRRSFVPLSDALQDSLDTVSNIRSGESGITGIASGYHELDAMTAGFQNSDLIIVAGRPSQGKTALALSVARNAALQNQKRIGVFSLEMSLHQLSLRLMSCEAKVNAHGLRSGRLSADDWKSVSAAAARLSQGTIFIDESPSLGILELRAKARRLRAEHQIDMVIVDYLQLIAGPKSAESREREISAISRSLKALAKELDIPVMALSQLNRQLEMRTDKRPGLSDLRESGAIEQDADVVLFVHRPETYGILEMKNDKGLTESTQGIGEIIVGKQRNGPIGSVRLAFVKEYAGFENLSHAGMEPPQSYYEKPEMPF